MCARRGVISTTSTELHASALQQDEWQYVRKSLLHRFVVVADPMPAKTILALARCSELIPPAVHDEVSLCVQLNQTSVRDPATMGQSEKIPSETIVTTGQSCSMGTNIMSLWPVGYAMMS